MNKYTPVPQLYNPKPQPGKPDARGWKTVNGRINEAKEVSTCLMRNAFLWGGYSWAVTVYIFETLAEEEVQDLWTHVTDNLRKEGLVAFWIREVTPADRVHYHLIVVGCMEGARLIRLGEQELKKMIVRAFPKTYRPKRRRRRFCICVKRANTYKKAGVACAYITKKKKPGKLKKGKNKGKMVDDIYKLKRHFFQPHVKLRVTGITGKFWKRSREDIWKDVIAHERAIKAVRSPALIDYAREVLPSLAGFSLKNLIRYLCEVEVAANKAKKTAAAAKKTPLSS